MINPELYKAKPPKRSKNKKKNRDSQQFNQSLHWAGRGDTASEESFWIAKHIYGYDGRV